MRELESILQTYRPQHQTRFRFLEVSFTVKSNSADLVRKLEDYFSAWDCPPGPDAGQVIHAIIGEGIVDNNKLVDVIRRPGKRVKEAYYDKPDGRIILKKRTGVVVYVHNGERYVVGNLLENFNQLVNQIDEIFVQHFLDAQYVLLHASAVKNLLGQTLVFCSESGTGKSTVAVSLLEKGFTFLSNDRVLLKSRQGIIDVVGVPKKPRINPGTILAIPSLHRMLSPEEMEGYAHMDRDELWHLERKYDVEVTGIYGPDAMSLRGNLVSLYLLDWHRNEDGLIIDSVPPEQALPLVRPNVLSLNPARKHYGEPELVEEHLRTVLREAPVCRIRGGVDVPGLAALLGDLWTT